MASHLNSPVLNNNISRNDFIIWANVARINTEILLQADNLGSEKQANQRMSTARIDILTAAMKLVLIMRWRIIMTWAHIRRLKSKTESYLSRHNRSSVPAANYNSPVWSAKFRAAPNNFSPVAVAKFRAAPNNFSLVSLAMFSNLATKTLNLPILIRNTPITTGRLATKIRCSI